MSAPLAKSDFVFKLSTSRSYIGADYDPAPVAASIPAAATAPRSLARKLGDGLALLVGEVTGWVRRQATFAEMEGMSDRELADIGLTRGDVPRVFDPAFVVDHARGRTAL